MGLIIGPLLEGESQCAFTQRPEKSCVESFHVCVTLSSPNLFVDGSFSSFFYVFICIFLRKLAAIFLDHPYLQEDI